MYSLLPLLSVTVLFGTIYAQVATIVETRSLDEIYEAAMAEGGIVNCWHGGDELHQQDALKQAFEARFPGVTLNLTVDLSKYLDTELDRQLSEQKLQVDSIILQSQHDYPRWDTQLGALMHYQPVNFYNVHPAFRDVRGAWVGSLIGFYSFLWNTDRIADGPKEFADFLKPEYKDKIVLTYPDDDDGVLYAFDLIVQEFGIEYFDALLAQNPKWVRGIQTPATLISQPNSTYSATFTTYAGLIVPENAPYNISFPTKGAFVSWAQRAGILRGAPHPEGAKLLHNFLLSEEWQSATGTWSVRKDIAPPAGYPELMDLTSTNPVDFDRWISDRFHVERLRQFTENYIGTAQGLSPLIDGI